MKVYHGTKSIESLNSIMQEGFTNFNKGFYGKGLYATSDINIALEFTNDENESVNKDLILELDIDSSLILEDTYKNLANKFFNKKEKENPSFYCIDPLWNLDKKLRDLGYKGCKINYSDTNEVIIIDTGIINSIRTTQ